jgi:aminomethyltransferase
VAIICIDNTEIGPVAVVDVVCADGEVRRCQLWTLPMCDAEGLIPRGKLVEMPEVC